MAQHYYFLLRSTYSVVVQIQLDDGNTVVFFAGIPQEPPNRLEMLLPWLLLTLAILIVLGAVALHTITRSLARQADHTKQGGTDIEGATLPEGGPSEIRRVINAFNRMCDQARVYL